MCFLILKIEDMLKLCLSFKESQPIMLIKVILIKRMFKSLNKYFDPPIG